MRRKPFLTPAMCHTPGSTVFKTLVLSCLALFFTLAGALPARAAASIATIIARSGDTQIRHVGGTQLVALRLSESLHAGDVLRTGANGKISVLFADGSQLRVAASTAVQLTAPTIVQGKTSFFKVLAGEIWARLRPGRAVRTQYANLIVRGTEINLDVTADGTTTLTVLEGEVQFFDEQGTVVVETSQQSVIHPGAAPTRPVTIANAGLIIDWTLDLNRAQLPRERFYNSLNQGAQQRALAQAQAAARANDTPAALAAVGDAYYDERRFEAALAQYQLAEKAAPADAHLLIRTGYALLELGQLDEAAASFNAALAAAPPAQMRAARIDTSARLTPAGWNADDNARARLIAGDVPAPAPDAAAATVCNANTGLAWVALQREQPQAALAPAGLAVAADGTSAEAHLVLALALMRVPGHAPEATSELAAARAGQPPTMAYQAQAWLALLALSQDDAATAVAAATQAVKQQPESALANAALASVEFYDGNSNEAARWAHRAVQLNPDSVATMLALAQAELAQGQVDAAATAAARAVALDPTLPEGYFVEGVADAGARDYSHAARELNRALQQAPDYLEAAGALARVYVQMDRPQQADALLQGLAATHPNSPSLLAARGAVLYAEAKYKDALALYRQAAAANPDSSVIAHERCRLALDDNQLAEAIDAGQHAVQLNPGISIYHSDLGLAYSYAHLDAQGTREFRTALALDPQNALALVELGLQDQEGDTRLADRSLAVAYIQGFINDPAVGTNLLRKGINTDYEGEVTNKGFSSAVRNNTVADGGALHSYSEGVEQHDSGNGQDSDTRLGYARNDSSYALDKATTVHLHVEHVQNDLGLPGQSIDNAPDDRYQFRDNEIMGSVKRQLSDRQSLTFGLFSSRQHNDSTNPNANFSSVYMTPGIVLNPSVPTQYSLFDTLEPEIRFDIDATRGSQATRFTLGAARPRTTFNSIQNLSLDIGVPGFPPLTGALATQETLPVDILYVQAQHQFGRRGSLVTQVRSELAHTSINQSGSFAGFVSFANQGQQSRRFTLPSASFNYRVGKDDQVRLLAGRRHTDVSTSVLEPISTLLTTEATAIPQGLIDPASGDLSTYELDFEHYTHGNLLKAFAFHDYGRNLLYDVSRYANNNDFDNDSIATDNYVPFDSIKRTGLGVRCERQIHHSLFGYATISGNRTTASSMLFNPALGAAGPAIFNNGQAPYHPRLEGEAGLNYIDTKGYKAGLALNCASSFYADTDNPTALTRQRVGGRPTVDLYFGRERSVHRQLLFEVTNLFNTTQYVFNDIRIGYRRIGIDYVQRF